MVGVPAKDKLKSLGESKDTSEADYDYEFDEKHKTVAPTERGVKKAEEFIGVDNLYLGEHGSLVNHLVQALKAESLYKRDKDYAVIDGEVMIIDEFTGRILEGRRWSEGLHQAVEAKEGVAIREENSNGTVCILLRSVAYCLWPGCHQAADQGVRSRSRINFPQLGFKCLEFRVLQFAHASTPFISLRISANP